MHKYGIKIKIVQKNVSILQAFVKIGIEILFVILYNIYTKKERKVKL